MEENEAPWHWLPGERIDPWLMLLPWRCARIQIGMRDKYSDKMAFPCALECIPDDISEHYLPYQLTLIQRQQADLFSREQYFYGVRIYKFETTFDVRSQCFRSQQKTESPHHVDIISLWTRS